MRNTTPQNDAKPRANQISVYQNIFASQDATMKAPAASSGCK